MATMCSENENSSEKYLKMCSSSRAAWKEREEVARGEEMEGVMYGNTWSGSIGGRQEGARVSK